jgi:hypothetical protein
LIQRNVCFGGEAFAREVRFEVVGVVRSSPLWADVR